MKARDEHEMRTASSASPDPRHADRLLTTLLGCSSLGHPSSRERKSIGRNRASQVLTAGRLDLYIRLGVQAWFQFSAAPGHVRQRQGDVHDSWQLIYSSPPAFWLVCVCVFFFVVFFFLI